LGQILAPRTFALVVYFLVLFPLFSHFLSSQVFAMKRSFLLGSLLIFPALLNAQNARPSFWLQRKASPKVLKALELSKGTLQRFTLPKGLPPMFRVRVALDGNLHQLILKRYSMRSSNYKLLVSDSRGIHEAKAGPSLTYRGFVEGIPGSVVAGSLIQGQLTAAVLLQKGKVFGIQAARPLDAALSVDQHVVYRDKDLRLPSVRCGVQGLGIATIPGGSLSPTAFKVAELAIDADYDYYRRYGSSLTKTQTQVQAVMNVVDGIYRRDVGIGYKITKILIRTSRFYSATSDIRVRLGQFRSQWNTNHGSIKRDMAHNFTGVGGFSGIVGVAYVGVVCSLGNAYGSSKAFHSSITTNAGLVCHEMGHNWGAGHCDSKGSDCKIMCSRLGGCGRSLRGFGKTSQGVIIGFRNSRNCLEDSAPPTLSSLSPKSIPVLGGVPVTLNGTGLSGITELTVGSKVVSYQIISDNQLRFDPPTPTALGPVLVKVKNSKGFSNALSLTYVVTHPPKLKASTIGYPKFVPIDYRVGAAPKGIFVLLISPSKATIPFLGGNLLQNFIILTAGGLDNLGLAKHSVPYTVSLKKVNLYSQAVIFSGFQFGGLTNITTTLAY
jgi:hypothetical protein